MTRDRINRYADGTVMNYCDVRDCQEPATHHTPSGSHYCDKDWSKKLVREGRKRRIRHNQAVANIHRIGRAA